MTYLTVERISLICSTIATPPFFVLTFKCKKLVREKKKGKGSSGFEIPPGQQFQWKCCLVEETF